MRKYWSIKPLTSRPAMGDRSRAYFASSASFALVNSTNPRPLGSLADQITVRRQHSTKEPVRTFLQINNSVAHPV